MKVNKLYKFCVDIDTAGGGFHPQLVARACAIILASVSYDTRVCNCMSRAMWYLSVRVMVLGNNSIDI